MSVGNKIKARRKELGWTQRDLATRMGYANHSTIVRVENGQIDLPQSRIGQFASALGVTPGYLMGWEHEPAAAELGEVAASVLQRPGILKMVQDYLVLSEEDQATVRTLVSSLAAKKKD